MSTLATRLRAAMDRKGWTQERLEAEAAISKGYVSRLLSGERKNLGRDLLGRIADALDEDPVYLVTGLRGSAAAKVRANFTPVSAVGARARTMEEVPGYADVELEVARLEPDIPIDVFRQARRTKFAAPLNVVTVEYLREYVKFLNRYQGTVIQSESGPRPRDDAELSETHTATRGRRRAK